MNGGGEIIYAPSESDLSLRQGEILTGLPQFRLTLESVRLGVVEQADYDVVSVTHPYAVVMSEDCDLIGDFARARKCGGPIGHAVPNVLFCEVIEASDLRTVVPPGSDIWKRVKENKDERYQFLQKVPPSVDSLGIGLPELGIDFKRYFSLPSEEVYERLTLGHTRRRCRLISPYLEHLSTRFTNFLSRVGLPVDHVSE